MWHLLVGLLLVSLVHSSVAENYKIDIVPSYKYWSERKIDEVRQPEHFVQSCDYVTKSGVYNLRLSTKSPPFEAFCDVESFYGKWLVIQQRVDGSVDFNRSLAEYRDGFGIVGESTEFWLGLERIRQVTASGDFELMIELKDETGNYGFARYSPFGITGEKHKYKMVSGAYSGTTGDDERNMQYFGTYNADNCVSSGWWLGYCKEGGLNGPYVPNPETKLGIYWKGWTKAATFIRMMIRRKQG